MCQCPLYVHGYLESKCQYLFTKMHLKFLNGIFVVVFQLLSHVWLFAISWTAECQPSLSFTISWSLLKLMSIELVIPSKQLILCHSLLLLPSIVPSNRVLSSELALCIRWPKCWNFSFSNSPSNEYSGLISFRIDWFELLAVQGTLKSLLQHRNSKAMHYSLPQIIQSSMGRKRPSCFPVVSRSLLYSSEKKVTFIFA